MKEVYAPVGCSVDQETAPREPASWQGSEEADSPLAHFVFETKPLSCFEGVGNRLADPARGLYIVSSLDWTSDQIIVNMLIDCGASHSLLDERVYASIPEELRPPLQELDVNVTLADGSVQPCSGRTEFPLCIGGKKHTITFLVGKWSDGAILGMTDLHALGLQIDFEKMAVKQNDQWIPTRDTRGLWVSRRVRVDKHTTIPPYSEMILKARVDDKVRGLGKRVGVWEPSVGLLLDHGLTTYSSLHRLADNNIPLVIENHSGEQVVLTPGTIIGDLVDPIEPTFCRAWDRAPETPIARKVGVNIEEGEIASVGGSLPSHVQELFDRSQEHLSPEETTKLRHLLTEYQDVFSKDNFDIGCTNLLTFSIDTGDHKPVKIGPRRMNPEAASAADEIIEELLIHQLIEPSSSPWSSPIVMVRRKDNRYRLCIDFRELNSRTLNCEAWPMPRIDDTLDCLSGAVFYCTTDLTSGYWQVPVDPASRPQTAFVHRSGLYQWRRKPFGVKEGPSRFSRMMAEHFRDMLYSKLLCFLDDVIVFGKNIEETMERYGEFCAKIRAANLKLKPSKCHLFQREVSFLGHRVSSAGVSCEPEKIKAVEEWPVPRTRRQVKSFLGLVNYYRRFIQDCAAITKPLTALTSLKVSFKWSPQCQVAFETLKRRLVSAPVLGYPREDGGQYYLDADACEYGVGAALSQEQGGEEVVIAYTSKTLSGAEVNYCVTRKELYAIVHGVRAFKCYLLSRKFTIRSDHSSLRYLNRFKEPEGQMARWIDFLQPFDYEIVYRPGPKHGNADALSRRPDPCGGKKCYCSTMDQLEFDPPVVMETHECIDTAVQTTTDLCEHMLRCCAIKEAGAVKPSVQCREVQTSQPGPDSRLVVGPGAPVHPSWPSHQITVGSVTLFFRRHTPLSNFYPCPVVAPDGRRFNCSEQWYQAEKARGAGDETAYHTIMAMSDPKAMKDRVKKVQNLELVSWRAETGIPTLREACWHKFSQNEQLGDHLLFRTGEVLAEASPYDSTYGIMLAMTDPRAPDPSQWAGSNEMGRILQDVKQRLLEARYGGACIRAVSIQPLWTLGELQQWQREDRDIAPVLELRTKQEDRPAWEAVSTFSVNSKIIIQEWELLSVTDGILRRIYIHPGTGLEWPQLVLPQNLVKVALQFAHENPASGHQGRKRTIARVQARFWWPRYRTDLRRYVDTCEACQRRKGPGRRAKEPLKSYVVGAVGERVFTDICGPFSEQEGSKAKYVIVAVCAFSKYAVAAAMPDMAATTVAQTLLTHWVAYLGVPLELHSDQGANYCGSVMKELCVLLGISKTQTCPLRPQGDGLAERYNRTLCDMLNTIGYEFPFSWETALPMAVLAYNSSVQSATGETPHAMLYGSEVRLPIALLDPMGDTVQKLKSSNPSEYIERLQRQIASIHHQVRGRLGEAALRQEKGYNNRLKWQKYAVGDVVYYYYPVKGKQPKEAYFKWAGPYVVVEARGPVYRIQKSMRSKSLVVNHDSLKPARLREPLDTAWAHEATAKRREATAEEAEEALVKDDTSIASGPARPRRQTSAPKMYGDWFLG